MADSHGKKLRRYIDVNRVNIADLLKRLEMSRGKLYQLFDKDFIKSEDILKLKAAGIDFMDESIDEVHAAHSPLKGNNILFVPIYAYGGFLRDYSNPVFLDTLQRFSLPGIHGEHFAFEVSGNSMAPYAKQGDVVISRKEERLDWMIKGRAYVLQTIEGLILKIYDSADSEKAYFKSADKSQGDDPVIPLKNIKGVYQVVKVLKDFMLSN